MHYRLALFVVLAAWCLPCATTALAQDCTLKLATSVETSTGPSGRMIVPVTVSGFWRKESTTGNPLPEGHHLYTFGDMAFFDCAGTRLFLTSRKDEGSAGQSILSNACWNSAK